jgi:hypothetical protein
MKAGHTHATCWKLNGEPDWVKAKKEWKQQSGKSAPAYNLSTNDDFQDVWMVSSKDQSDSDTIYFDTACYSHTSSNRGHFDTLETVVGNISHGQMGRQSQLKARGLFS